MREYVFGNVTSALPTLMNDVLVHGDEVGSRNGPTKELTHVHIALTSPCSRAVITPLRKASLPAQIAETVWVLSGRNDIGWLSHYLPRAKDFSDDGEVWSGGYGQRLRRWPGGEDGVTTDQLANVIDLLRRDPGSRRAVMSIFDPARDQQDGKDIPCNNWLHFISRLGKLDLHVAIRSNDLMWGWSGINAFEWSALLEMVAYFTGLEVGELHFSISSLHLYARHWDKARKIAELTPPDLPGAVLASPAFELPLPQGGRSATVTTLDWLFQKFFEEERAIREGGDYQLDNFPEPMLQSWLRVLAWWWRGDETALDHLQGTALYKAAISSPGRPAVVAPTPAPALIPNPDSLADYVAKMHAEKHAVYGDSWKRRGEMLGILSNVARKIDRLGRAGAGDTEFDTRADFLVYLLKYWTWLVDECDAWLPSALQEACRVGGEYFDAYTEDRLSDLDGPVAILLHELESRVRTAPQFVGTDADMIKHVNELFTTLEQNVRSNSNRLPELEYLVESAWWLLSREWWRRGNETRSWKGYDNEA